MTDINDVIKTIDELIDGGVLTQYAIARGGNFRRYIIGFP